MYEFTIKNLHYKLPTRVAFAIHAARVVRAPVFLLFVPPLVVLAGWGIASGGGPLQVLSLLAVMLLVTLLIATAHSMQSMLLDGVHHAYIAGVVQTTKVGQFLAKHYQTPAP